jgi:hypothetical protein
VKLRLREKKKVSDIKDQYGGRQFESTGELVFVIDIGSYERKEIKDGQEPVESKISSIIAMIELEGQRMKVQRIESEIWRIKREEQHMIEQELREQQDKEVKAFKKIFLQAIRLHQANILRNCIYTVETNAKENGNVTDEFKNWKIWAEQKIAWYDPMINGEDPILNNSHKTNLFKDLLKNDSNIYLK